MSINLVILAIATTISPLFLLAAVIMMSTSQKVRTAWAAAIGWFVSIGACALVMVIVGGAVSGTKSHHHHWWMGVLDVLFGLFVGYLAYRSWRRAHVEHGKALPKWMDRVGSMSVIFAIGLGMFLPPTVLAFAAGNEINQQHVSDRTKWTAVFIYAAIGTLVEIVPILWLTLQPSRREHRLSEWNSWLDEHWQEVIAGLFGVISIFLVVKGGVAIVKSI
jgi:threonine/homoserine/homoserine lactone efflux protein